MKKIIIITILSAICADMTAQTGVAFLLKDTNPAALSVAKTGVENLTAVNALSGNKLYFDASFGWWSPENTDNKLLGLGGYYNFDKLSVGLQGKFNICKPYAMYDMYAQPLGTFSPKEAAVGVDFAYSFLDSWSAGIRANVLVSNLSQYAKAASLGVDASVAYSNNGFTGCFALRNIGPALNYGDFSYKLPSYAALGASYSIAGFTGYAEADYLFADEFMLGVGAEYTVIDLFTFRAGFHYGADAMVPTYVSLGIGAKIRGAQISAAFIPSAQRHGSTCLLGLSYSF